MATLLLVRHGQSVWNAERRWQGQADPELSELGRQQAFQAAARVGAVDVIASSPQQRAFETALIISEQLGVGPVVAVPDLRERSAGSWSGLTVDDIHEQYPGWIDDGRRPDDFETTESLVPRVEAALRELALTYAGGMLLVVCHGGVIHAFEEHHGLIEGRVPNLAGRIVSVDPTAPASAPWVFGDQLQLLDQEARTGGDAARI